MKKILLGLFLLALFIPIHSYAYVSVKGYYKSNGTYVAPYVRSNPNGLKYDNYSYKPSQGLYNASYGTKDSTWDTPTYITDPDYYVGQNIYNAKNNEVANIYTALSSQNIKPTKNVSYVVKTWVENNPSSECLQSTFLRQTEKQECISYKSNLLSYNWNITTNEFDGKHYVYDPKNDMSHSCKDGYQMSVFNSPTSQCIPESQSAVVICPTGYTCTPVK